MSDFTLEDAVAYSKKYEYEKASAIIIKLLRERPDYIEAWALRGDILYEQEAYFDALLHFDKVISIKDDEWAVWVGRGNCLTHLRWWEEAGAAYKKSLIIHPSAEAYMGLALLNSYLMNLHECLIYYSKVVTMNNDPAALYSLGAVCLGMGDWERGFKYYKARWLSPSMSSYLRTNFKEWDGTHNKAVLMYVEGGYGDEIMTMRFAKLAGEKAILEVRPPMARLADLLDVPIIVKGDKYSPSIECSCSALDVPYILKMTWRDIPRQPYLKVEGKWTLPETLNIGLCWATGTHFLTKDFSKISKSIAIEDYRCFMRNDVNFISLQKPAEKIPRDMKILDFSDALHDFEDTAELINALDLVITVDTAVAHLAGALGKPVWNFVRYDGYWPWMDPRVLPSSEYSVWYESMRLFRQKEPFNWYHPLKKAEIEFHRWVDARKT